MRPELIKGTAGNVLRSFSNSLLIIQLVRNGLLPVGNLCYWSKVSAHGGAGEGGGVYNSKKALKDQ